MSPPGPFRGAFQLHKSPPGYGRKSRALPKREGIVQCRQCKAIGSGTMRGERLEWSDLPHKKDTDTGQLEHLGCGGHLAGFDIRRET